MLLRREKRQAGGSARALRPWVSHLGSRSNVNRTTRCTSRSTRGTGRSWAGSRAGNEIRGSSWTSCWLRSRMRPRSGSPSSSASPRRPPGSRRSTPTRPCRSRSRSASFTPPSGRTSARPGWLVIRRQRPTGAARTRRYQQILQDANRAGLEHLEQWAVTRTGGGGQAGRWPGAIRFEDAGMVVTSWLQGTSRDGDPQDHIHNQIARMSLTARDGKWRALDTAGIRARSSARCAGS